MATTHYRTHTCGALRAADVGAEVSLTGWVSKVRDKGFIIWIDLRDRYGVTQLVANESDTSADLLQQLRDLGREYVVQVKGKVISRESANDNIPTGQVEVQVSSVAVLNEAKLPPFTIEEETDGGDEQRMEYRFLDLRRPNLQRNLIFRSRLALEARAWLGAQSFVEVETPFLIKSTPEGARDFAVPSRMHPGEFYALPQSPQTFKQLLMVSGYDRYFQIVKCFRDEDLRADRQPEFTQIDCEMSFVSQEDILNTFEGLTRHLFKTVLGKDIGAIPRMTYDEAMSSYGIDKPDLRFEMKIKDLTSLAQGKGFKVFDSVETIVGIAVKGAAGYSRKQLDKLTKWVQREQIGAKGLVYVKCNEDGSFKSSVDSFFAAEDFQAWQAELNAEAGDLLLVMAGEREKTLKQLGLLRLHVGELENLIDPMDFKPLWVVDFPLLEWDEDSNRFHAMHHPFTSPKKADIEKMESNDLKVLSSLRADAYDLVINGSEIGGGSIRIHDRDLQSRNFKLLGFTPEEAEAQFGFLLSAFEFGAPPHGGIAFGFDRLCAVMSGQSSIRDFIAFPKNNQGRDVMIKTPSAVDAEQLAEWGLDVVTQEES